MSMWMPSHWIHSQTYGKHFFIHIQQNYCVSGVSRRPEPIEWKIFNGCIRLACAYGLDTTKQDAFPVVRLRTC